jgi:uncharacterized membrane protein YgcG
MQPTSQTHDDETVLFLFLAFSILVVLLFVLALLACQTWMVWKIASVVVEEERGRNSSLRYKDREGGVVVVEQGEGGFSKGEGKSGRNSSVSVVSIGEREGVVGAGR